MDPRQSPRYIGEVPIPALPDPADYDLGLTSPTYFEAFRIFVPWIDFAQRGPGLPADFQINGPGPVDGAPLAPLDLSRLFGPGSSEVRRVGNGFVSTGTYRLSPYHSYKNTQHTNP